MTYKLFAQYIRKQSGTNLQTFPDADILLYANIFKDDISKRIVRLKQDQFGIPQTMDLLVNVDGSPQREYPLDDSNIQQVKYVEANFTGKKWVPLEEMDLTGYRGATDEATIAGSFGVSKNTCFYDLFRRSIFLYSGTFGAVVGGLKIWTFQWPADFADLTKAEDIAKDPTNTSSGFPREFHELLARRVIIARKMEGDKPLQLTDSEKKYEQDLSTALDEFSDHGPIFAELPEEQAMDNGFNL